MCGQTSFPNYELTDLLLEEKLFRCARFGRFFQGAFFGLGEDLQVDSELPTISLCNSTRVIESQAKLL